MASHRTTIILDEDSKRAARELALRLDCSTSEAIRRAIISHKEQVFGIPLESRRERTETLLKWIEASKDMDPEAEISRLKAEDEGF